MKKLQFACLLCALSWSLLATDYNNPVLSGDWMLTEGHTVYVYGTMTGAGDLHWRPDITTKELFLRCENQAQGDIYVDWGCLRVENPSGLGSGTIYVNDEVVSEGKYISFLNPMTVANPIVLGTEQMSMWARRLAAKSNGEVKLTGLLTVNSSKIQLASGTLTLAGGVTGNKLVCEVYGGLTASIAETPVSLSDSLWCGNTGSVSIKVPGNAVPAVHGFGGGRFCLDVDDAFADEPVFAPLADNAMTFDLNGHSVALGGVDHEGANRGDSTTVTLCNSVATARPTVSVRQLNDAVGTSAVGSALQIVGPMNFVKKGPARLKPKAYDLKAGVLTVEEGAFILPAGTGTRKLADTVVVAGGTLDLGGGSFACHRLELRGGRLVNGTLAVADVCELHADTEVTATVQGRTVKPAGTDVSCAGAIGTSTAAAPYSYTLPEGTIFYMPFDTESTMLCDYGSCGAVLSPGAGSPRFAPAGRNGGCLYLDGASTLVAPGVPAGFPVGDAHLTISFWVKLDDGCSARGGWFSYGGGDWGKGSSLCMTTSFSSLKWYTNGRDIWGVFPTDLRDGAWHQVVGTWNGTFRDVYLDGVRVINGVGGDAPLDAGTEMFMVGKTMWDDHFKGWMDELLVLDHALDADEVAALYAGEVARRPASAGPELVLEGGTLASTSSSPAVAFPFDSEASFLLDASATGATLVNQGVAFRADSAFGAGGSAYFNGGAFLAIPDEVFPSAIPSGNAPRTLLCFVKPDADVAREGAFFSYGHEGWGGGDYMNFALREGGNKIGLFPWGSENGYFRPNRDQLVGRWHSVAAIWDGAKVSFYYDGSLALEPTKYDNSTQLNTHAAGFKIGKAFYDGTSYFKGCIDEVAVCDRVLTADEIAAYHRLGVAALLPKPLAEGTRLTLAAGAVLDSADRDQTVAALAGAGAVTAKSLTVTDALAGSVSVTGGLVLGNGLVVDGVSGTTVVDGTATLAGAGTVEIPAEVAAAGCDLPLVRATDFSGLDNLADWTVTHVPGNAVARVFVRDGVLRAVISRKGCAIFIR